MTDGLDQALANVGLDLLRADTDLKVHDGKVPDTVPNASRPPYVLVYTLIDRPDEDEDRAMDGRSSVWVVRWICHCVGSGADASAARAVAQRVRTQLLDVQPTVPGLACGRIRSEASLPPDRDESTGRLVMDAVLTFRLRATSA